MGGGQESQLELEKAFEEELDYAGQNISKKIHDKLGETSWLW